VLSINAEDLAGAAGKSVANLESSVSLPGVVCCFEVDLGVPDEEEAIKSFVKCATASAEEVRVFELLESIGKKGDFVVETGFNIWSSAMYSGLEGVLSVQWVSAGVTADTVVWFNGVAIDGVVSVNALILKCCDLIGVIFMLAFSCLVGLVLDPVSSSFAGVLELLIV